MKDTVDLSRAFAACFTDLFPQDENTVFLLLMQQLGYQASDRSTEPATSSGVGIWRVRPFCGIATTMG